MPSNEEDPGNAGANSESETTTSTHHSTGGCVDDTALKRQAQAWRRRPWLECGCSDSCRCEYRDNPSPKRVDAYADAVGHLADHGLPAAGLTAELRLLWRRGGADRAMAERIVRRWAA